MIQSLGTVSINIPRTRSFPSSSRVSLLDNVFGHMIAVPPLLLGRLNEEILLFVSEHRMNVSLF